MSSSVDSRIVTMKFDNTQFERGVTTTLGTMGKLKQSLNFTGSTKGLDGVSATIKKAFDVTGVSGGIDRMRSLLGKLNITTPFSSGKKAVQDLQSTTDRFSMGHMEGGITHVSKSFLALTTVAVTALSTITSRAISAGSNLIKSLTVAPIMDGFHEYETNMNSIQTILANTGMSGKKGLSKVNSALNQLNTYSDKTIYNFSEMARNIGTFTAAGVDLKTSVASIKGIANLAALSGSNSQQASTAMYQLSQAIASGRVGLQDWNSVVNAGMGGKVFQSALARTASAMGTLSDNSVKTTGKMKKLTIDGESFRQSITAKPGQTSWLTSDVLTNTLKQFGGNMTAAQLKAQGFKKAQIQAILQMGKTGTEAATKIKTLSQLMSTIKESVGSGWGKTFQLLFGNFGEAKNLFTATSNFFGKMISNSAKARNQMLGQWKKFGGRDAAIDVLVNSFHALQAIINPIKSAFRDIFPAMTGKHLADITKSLRDFTDSLTISGKTSENLRRTFRGVFAVFDILRQVVGGVIGVFFNLFKTVGSGSGGFLKFTGGVGDFLVALDNAIKKGHLLSGFFAGLTSVIRVPLKVLGSLMHVVASLFSGFDTKAGDNISGTFGKLQKRMSPIAALANSIANIWGHLTNAFGKAATAIQPFVATIGTAFTKIGDAIANAFSGDNFSHMLDAVNTGLLAGLVLAIKHFATGDMFKIDIPGGGMFKSVTGSFNQLTATLKSMQQQIKADTMIKIAAAIGIITASVVALSLIDSKKLTKSLGAVGVSFGILQVSVASLSKAVSGMGTLKLPLITGSLILLAGAMALLTVSVVELSKVKLWDLVKGLGAVAAMLGMLVLVSGPLGDNSSGMIRAGAGMILLALGIKVMASAVKDFAAMSWSEMLKGFSGLVASLIAVAATMRLMPRNMAMQAASLTLLAVAVKIMASAVGSFAAMSWESMLRGILGLATALSVIAAAMGLMPKSMLIQAASLVVVGTALKSIQAAVSNMGGMTWDQIAKGMTVLSASLAILAGGLYLMSGTLMGSAALLVAAAALAVLAPVMVILGSLSWTAIIKSMTVLAATFVILGAAGLLLAPIVPIILGLGAAMFLFGAGLGLAGLAAMAFATAFGIVVAAGTAGITILSAVLQTFAKALPGVIQSFAQGIVRFAGVIANNVGTFSRAFGAILTALLNAVIRNAPKMAQAFMAMLNAGLRVISQTGPAIFNAGIRLIMGFLNAISRNIGGIVTVVSNIIVKFLNALGKNLPRIINAGFNFIINFMNGLTRAINKNSRPLSDAGWNLAIAIVNGMIEGLKSGVSAVASWAKYIAQQALNTAKHWLGIASPSKEFAKIGMYSAQGLANGLRDNSHVSEKSAKNLAVAVLDSVKSTIAGLSDNLSGEIDMNPVIAPVLDLTQVKRDASTIGGLISTDSLNAGYSYSQAAGISNDTQAAKDAGAAQAAAAIVQEVKFEQNNYSPESLSATEIYRRTKNQLSQAKSALSAQSPLTVGG